MVFVKRVLVLLAGVILAMLLRQVADPPGPKEESIGVLQGLMGHLNYGDLTVPGTGGAREVFRRVRDPIGFRNHVQQASLGSGGASG